MHSTPRAGDWTPNSPDLPLHAGDRIELLRRLELDPKQARRLRAERARGKTARERS
jgi:putative ubiquitin-RnfH superfamily antitoxin RatB of RatAB toxin-antitoxin module